MSGAAPAIMGLEGLSFELIEGHGRGFARPEIVLTAGAAPLALAAFLRREARARPPMLPLEIFRARNSSAGNGATLCLHDAFNGSFFLLMIHLQSALEDTPPAGESRDLAADAPDAAPGLEVRPSRRAHRAGAP